MSYPKQFGKYQVKELLGRGAMAEVYRAFQPNLEREVAIKVIHTHLAKTPQFVERFRTEAKIIAALRHPGIVQVFDFDIEDDLFYMVMEYVPGESLKDYLAARRAAGQQILLSKALALFRAMVEAVAYAHQKGVVHRDLKPANVLLTADEQPILADFGLSRLIGADRLTDPGTIIGTPAYMSPEQGSGEPGDERSDIYSLGVILYELTTGTPPFYQGSPVSIILKHLDEPPPPPGAINANLPEPVIKIIQTALEKEPANRFQAAPKMLEQLDDLAISVTLQINGNSQTETRCPYRGLQAFEADHAEFFFGRETLITQLTDKLTPVGAEPAGNQARLAQFLAIIGASGSGKSSLVQAGLVPNLQNQAVPGSNNWVIKTIRPGSHPLKELATSLAPLFGLNAAQFLAELLARGSALHAAAYQNWLNAPSDRRLLLIIDQFEELFTLCRNDQVRQQFIENLLFATAVRNGRVIILLTMRADFYHRCAAFQDLARRIAARQILVGPLNETELRRAIEQPAYRVGLKFEPGLVETILEDVVRQPGALPLLQYALLELWERRQGRLLTLAAYKSIGGVVGAISQRADNLYHKLTHQQQVVVKRIMLRLTQPGEGTEDTRRRVKKQELLSIGQQPPAQLFEDVLQRLAEARLITTSRDMATGEELVDVSHEALIRGWGRLRGWIDENRAALVTHRQLTEAAEAWDKSQRNPSYLYQGARLVQAREWARERAEELNQLERAFLETSQAAVVAAEQEKEAVRQRELIQAQALAKEQQQRAEIQAKASQRLRWLAAGLAVVILLAIGAAIVAKNQQQKAELQAHLTHLSQLAAQALFFSDKQPDLGLLLSVELNKRSKTAEIKDNLIFNLNFDPALDTFLHGHVDGALSVAFSPTGKLLASGGRDATVMFWDVAARQPLGPPLTNHTFNVWDVAFSPDGKLLASASGDTSIILWDVATRQPIGSPLMGHQDQVWSVAFSPNGEILASASADKTVRLWDLATRTQIGQPLTAHTDEVKSVAFSPAPPQNSDDQLLASAGRDGAIILWDVATRQPVGPPLTQHTKGVETIAFSPATPEGAGGQLLASGGDDNIIILWDVATRRPIGPPLIGHSNLVISLAFSPDGKILASGSEDHSIILWDVATRQRLGLPLVSAERVSSVAFSPATPAGTGGALLASGIDNKTIALWDISTRQFLLGHDEWINTVAFNSTGQMLASGGDDDTIVLWDVATGQPVSAPLTGHSSDVLNVAFSPNDKILASAGADNTVRLWDVDKQHPLGPPLAQHTDWVSSVAFSPNPLNKLLASASADTSIILWNTDTLQPVGPPLTGHTAEVLDVAFHPQGNILASASADNTIILWDVTSGQPLHLPLKGHTDWVWGIDFSPNGQILASASNDKSVRLWDVATGQPLHHPLLGHTDQVWGVAFDSTGKILASSSRDKTIILWDVSEHRPLAPPFTGHTDWVWGIDFAPRQQLLASASRDGAVILWKISPDSWASRACRVANRNLTLAEWNEFMEVGQPYQQTCLSLPR